MRSSFSFLFHPLAPATPSPCLCACLLQYDKFMDVEFGRCPRVLCGGQPLLPVGQADLPRKYTVSLFCPRCNDIYYPRSSRHASELHPTAVDRTSIIR